MKHPNRDEWVPFVFGETTPETAQSLNAHLASCAECRTQVDSWRRSLKRLDAWELPAQRRGGIFSRPLVAWAAAAAIVLGIGFGLGRLAPPSADPKKMARLEAAIQATLTAQIQEQVRKHVAAELGRGLGQTQLVSANDLASLEARFTAARKADSAQLAKEVVSLLEAQQDEDRAVTEAILAKFLALRKDLETVATVADEQLQDTQLKLAQLSTASLPEH
jgi:anti-sigma factor RsiW